MISFVILIGMGVVIRIMRVTGKVMPITSRIKMLWRRLGVTKLTGVQPIMSFNHLRQLVLYNIIVLGNDRAVVIPILLRLGRISISRSSSIGRMGVIQRSLIAYNWGEWGVMRSVVRRRMSPVLLDGFSLSMSPAHAVQNGYFVAVLVGTSS
jgi:hypothetical protein